MSEAPVWLSEVAATALVSTMTPRLTFFIVKDGRVHRAWIQATDEVLELSENGPRLPTSENIAVKDNDGAYSFTIDEHGSVVEHWPRLLAMIAQKYGVVLNNPFEMKVDILERDESGALVKTGTKVFKPADRPMNKWVKRPKATELALPMVSWQPQTGKVYADTVAEKSVGWLVSKANDVHQAAQVVSLHSGPTSANSGWSITPDNFLESMVVMACRKLVKPTWLNDRDEFNIPLLDHPAYPQFALDCVIFALFHGANYSSSLDPVEYKGQTFELFNQFFWIEPQEFKTIPGMPPKTVTAALKAKTPFVVDWMKGKVFSPDAQQVLDAATSMFVEAAAKRNSADHKYQLHRWDAGWYQVRFGLYGKDIKFKPTPGMIEAQEHFKAVYTVFADRMRELMYTLDVLPH